MTSAERSGGGALRALIAEPLLHFALIGAVIFAIGRFTAPEEVDPNLIVIDSFVLAELSDLYFEEHGERPTTEKLEEIIETYVVSETLYREARNLQLDTGDEMMRARLVQRMGRMLTSGIFIADAPEAALQAHYQENLDDFSAPPVLSIEIYGLDGSQMEAEQFASQLAIARESGEGGLLRRPGAQLVQLKRRPRGQLVELLGETFIAEIEAGPQSTWRPVSSPRGWQVARWTERAAGETPPFEAVRPDVVMSWRAYQERKQRYEALQSLRESYPVARSEIPPELVSDADADGLAQ